MIGRAGAGAPSGGAEDVSTGIAAALKSVTSQALISMVRREAESPSAIGLERTATGKAGREVHDDPRLARRKLPKRNALTFPTRRLARSRARLPRRSGTRLPGGRRRAGRAKPALRPGPRPGARGRRSARRSTLLRELGRDGDRFRPVLGAAGPAATLSQGQNGGEDDGSLRPHDFSCPVPPPVINPAGRRDANCSSAVQLGRQLEAKRWTTSERAEYERPPIDQRPRALDCERLKTSPSENAAPI